MQNRGLKEDLTTLYKYTAVKTRQGGKNRLKLTHSWHKKTNHKVAMNIFRPEIRKRLLTVTVASIQGNLPGGVCVDQTMNCF